MSQEKKYEDCIIFHLLSGHKRRRGIKWNLEFWNGELFHFGMGTLLFTAPINPNEVFFPKHGVEYRN
jgi:hypothetical protein